MKVKRLIAIACIISIILILACSMLLGCAKQAAAPLSVQPTTPTVFKIKVSCSTGPTVADGKNLYVPLTEAITKESNGRIIAELYASQSLVQAKAALDSVSKGICDIQDTPPSYYPAEMNIANVWTLWGLQNDAVTCLDWTKQLTPKYFQPEMDKMNVRIIGARPMPTYYFYAPKVKITSLDELKGRLCKVTGNLQGALLTALGMKPVDITSWDVYEGLQKGTVDMTAWSLDTMRSMKVNELANPGYILDVGGLNGCQTYVLMNGALWSKLPTDLQQLVYDLGWKWGRNACENYERDAVDSLKQFLAQGIKYSSVSAADVEKVKTLAVPIRQKWADEGKAKGYLAYELLDEILKLKAGK